MIVRQSTVAILQTFEVRFEALSSISDLDSFIERFERVPDVLLTDYRLTDGTASDAIKKLNDACGAEIPTIVLTGEIGNLLFDTQTPVQVIKKPASPETITQALAAAVRLSDFPVSSPLFPAVPLPQ